MEEVVRESAWTTSVAVGWDTAAGPGGGVPAASVDAHSTAAAAVVVAAATLDGRRGGRGDVVDQEAPEVCAGTTDDPPRQVKSSGAGGGARPSPAVLADAVEADALLADPALHLSEGAQGEAASQPPQSLRSSHSPTLLPVALPLVALSAFCM